MPTSHGKLTRRSALKGLGVTMCLPFLEALAPAVLAAEKALPNSPTGAPVRMAVLYMPNGVNPHTWLPEGKGAAMKLSPILAPLEPLKSEILVLSQLMNKQSIEGDGHYVKVAPFLTGTHITKTTGSDLRCGGVSLDQLMAQRIGNLTPLPSLELSVESVTTGVDTNVGYTRLYGSHISWSSPTTPMTREIAPKAAFDRLFRPRPTPKAAAEDASILDAVADDAQRLRATIGKADRAKLDEYFTAVRSVEGRIQADAARRASQVREDPAARREIARLGDRIRTVYDHPADGDTGIDHTEQVRIMLDLMVLAFWTDTTRVATFMYGNEVSGRNFSFLPGVDGGHHQISHHENDPAKLAQYQRINMWHIEQYAYMLSRMRDLKEGDGSLLDHSMVLFASGMKDGNAHEPHNLPVVLAGRGGGTLATGRSLAYSPNTPLCDLHLAMAKRMGAPLAQFGDSAGELPGLSDATFMGA